MRNLTLTTAMLIVLCTISVFGQQKDTKNIIWVSPSKAKKVNGLMLNFWPQDDYQKTPEYPTINGVELNVNPISIFMPPLVLIHCLEPQAHSVNTFGLEKWQDTTFKFKKVNGLQMGLLNIEPTVINGVDINVSGSFDTKVNGVTVSAIINKQISMNGVTIASLGNHNNACNGVQIGLINSCTDLEGVQIGLWNTNQKRKLPFINWSFEKEKVHNQ